MTYEQFWNEDCWIAYYNFKAWKIKKQQLNEQYWLQGLYFYEALLDVSPVLRAFAKKGTKPIEYPSKPFNLFKEETEAKDKKVIEAEQLKAKLFFENWAKATAKKFNK